MDTKELNKQFGYLFDEELIQSIAEVGISRQYRKDDIIIDIGQELNYIPLLLEGNIKIMREDENGHEILLYVLERGDTCAMSLICCMKKSKSKIRASADKDSKIILIPVQYMTEWFQKNESWRNFILQSYQIRFNEMLETIDTLAFMKMDERIHKYLKDQVKLNGSNELEITHQKISDDLNTSRVVVSRLLKQLEDEKKIKTGRNKIEVLEY